MRFGFALSAVMLLLLLVSEGADRKESSSAPWIVAARIIRNGEQSGSGVYLKSGLIITAAHLTAADATMSVRIAGVVLPAKVLKQGSSEDVDLSLLSVNEERLPASIELPRMQLCDAPPWPGDPVIVVDAERAARSHIVSPQVLSFAFRSKFSTLIADVATTGNSGSGVFDPNRKCLLGIMSRKFFSHTTEGDKDIAKYFVPAVAIRDFLPSDSLKGQRVLKRGSKMRQDMVDPPFAACQSWRLPASVCTLRHPARGAGSHVRMQESLISWEAACTWIFHAVTDQSGVRAH